MDLPISQREGLLASLAPRWVDFLRQFCADFDEVRLCLPLDSDITPEVIRGMGFPQNMRLIRLPYYIGPDRFLKKLPALLWQGLRVGLTQARECEVICYNSPSLLGCIFGTGALVKGRPQIEFIRGDKLQILPQAYRWPKGWFYFAATWLFESWMDIVRRLGNVITFTQGSALCEKYQPRNRGRVFPMTMMVSATALRPISEIEAARKRESTVPVILYVGRLSHEKGVGNLLKAASILAREHDERFTLRIVGTGPEETRLKRLAVDLDLNPYLEWTGQVPHGLPLFREYDGATVFVLPSFSEGSPAAVAEAMARGVPVVASRVGGVPDLVREGVTGLMVDSGDSGQLAGAIRRLMSDSELRKQLATNARAEVASHTLQDQYRQMLSILREEFALPLKTEASV